MDSTELIEEIHSLRKEVADIKAHIPPKWVLWMFGVVLLSVLSWGTWITAGHIRQDAETINLSRSLADHRSLPIHPGAAEQLIIIRGLIADLRTDVKVMEAKIEKLRDAYAKDHTKP